MKLPSGGLQPKAGPVPQEINPPTSGTAAKEKGGVMSEDVELMLLSERRSLENEVRELLLKLKKTEAKRDDALCELEAVMVSVDKWFEDGDPELKNNEATRSASAREIALKAIEKEWVRANQRASELEETKRRLDAMISKARWYAEFWSPTDSTTEVAKAILAAGEAEKGK